MKAIKKKDGKETGEHINQKPLMSSAVLAKHNDVALVTQSTSALVVEDLLLENGWGSLSSSIKPNQV